LDESWAGLFRQTLLPELPVERVMPFFSPDQGRPTKEIYAMLGAVLFQQIFDLTDEETVSQMAFNLQWHYALDNPEESDSVKYLSLKTLWSLRSTLTDNDLDTVLFEKITATLAKVFRVDTSKQRLDSVHIKSNMRRLGRIGILVRCLHKFLVNLKRQSPELFAPAPGVGRNIFGEGGCLFFLGEAIGDRTEAGFGQYGSFPGCPALCG
jgi:hypothetical protein